jgi:hypothetical protein
MTTRRIRVTTVQKRVEPSPKLASRTTQQYERLPVQTVYQRAQLGRRRWSMTDFMVLQRAVGNRRARSVLARRGEGAFGSAGALLPSKIQTPLLQRSPLSDSVDSLWKASQSREAILDRLSKDDAFANRTDADLQKSLAAIFTNPDDLWLAQKVLNRQLGESSGSFKGKPVKLPIELSFFKGTSTEKALVIAGVHGTEQQGIQVAEMLKNDLAAKTPYFNVILVPSLFPVNAKNRFREGSNETNRNFPEPAKTLAEAKKNRRGEPLDADGDVILIENQLLIQLIERFQPSRIISIHGTQYAHQAGVFSDPITTQPDRAMLMKVAADMARFIYSLVPWGNAQDVDPSELQKMTALVYDSLVKELARQNTAQTQRDVDLSVKTAQAIAGATNKLAGLQTRYQSADILKKIAAKLKKKPGSPEFTAAVESLRQNPAVAGNKLDQKQSPTWGGEVRGGVSLGGYAPSRGISVFTVEPAIDRESSTYPQATLDPGVSQVERKAELQAYADAVRTILLGR